ncbi:hypothetical protein DH2020_019288 [Rehmannia glutinosa]|uniref:PWWP domain-containing protein n=1 Tax=Rehmannia glutinosa TaxID=99300 RepID=A0ABR0WN65_REHGL
MEDNNKTSETLDNGFVESKLSQTENPCNKIKEADSVFVCNLSNKRCTDDVYSGHFEPSPVELARKLGNVSIKESMFCDGIFGNKVNKGCSSDSWPNDKFSVLANVDKVNNNDVPNLERDLKFSGNDGIYFRKIEEHVEKSDDVLRSHELIQVEKVMKKGDQVLHPHELNSPTKIEVSGNSINLFVEVFGPLESNVNVNHAGEHVLGESDSNQEYSPKEKENKSRGVKNAISENEGENVVGEKECAFDVGDLVWVKTRTTLWWPGMISDPSDASNDTMKSERKGTFLVKYFGNANFVWCEKTELKPFIEYFEQMSVQNTSRSLCGSVERALWEIGRRVKSKMTCPCFSKDSETHAFQSSAEKREENLMPTDKKGKFDVPSLSPFEPATFLACIRQFASSVYVPGKIELTIMKNHLSSFYCSLGHCDLPLQLLRDGLTSEVIDEGSNNISGGGRKSVRAKKKRNHSDDVDLVPGDKNASSDKGSELRERKKSKYLSYPYIDVNKGLNAVSNSEQEKTEDSSLSTKSTPLDSMKSRKKGLKKSFKGHHIVSKADDINASSTELLAELSAIAYDHFYLSRSKYSDSLKRFYSSFRLYAFLDADIANKESGGQSASNLEKRKPKSSTKSEKPKEKINVVKESENLSPSVKESVDNAVGNKFPETDNPRAKGSVIRKSTKKPKSEKPKEKIKVVKQSENLSSSVKESVDNAVGNKFPKTDNPQAKGSGKRKNSKKKEERTMSAGLESKKDSFNMDTNIAHNSSLMISFEQTCSDVPKSEPTLKKIEEANLGLPHSDSVSGLLPDLNGNHPISVEQTRMEELVSPIINGADLSVFASSKDVPVGPQNIWQFNNGINSANKCRNGEFSTREAEPNVINMGLGSFIQQSPQMEFFPKLEPKKRKREEKTCEVASAIPDLNGNVLDMSSSEKTLPPDGNLMSPGTQPQQKRGRKKSGSTESGPNVNKEEDPGGSVLLNFAPGSDLPSKEILVPTFSRFGLLKESEIQFSNDDSSIKIPYERTSDARFAFRSLEKGHAFGESLVSFKLDCVPSATKKKVEKKINLPAVKQPFVPVDASRNLARPGETPDIAVMKRNVEMMKLSLEKMGNIPEESRARLENEIKVFLDKIGSTAGSSSSS